MTKDKNQPLPQGSRGGNNVEKIVRLMNKEGILEVKRFTDGTGSQNALVIQAINNSCTLISKPSTTIWEKINKLEDNGKSPVKNLCIKLEELKNGMKEEDFAKFLLNSKELKDVASYIATGINFEIKIPKNYEELENIYKNIKFVSFDSEIYRYNTSIINRVSDVKDFLCQYHYSLNNPQEKGILFIIKMEHLISFWYLGRYNWLRTQKEEPERNNKLEETIADIINQLKSMEASLDFVTKTKDKQILTEALRLLNNLSSLVKIEEKNIKISNTKLYEKIENLRKLETEIPETTSHDIKSYATIATKPNALALKAPTPKSEAPKVAPKAPATQVTSQVPTAQASKSGAPKVVISKAPAAPPPTAQTPKSQTPKTTQIPKPTPKALTPQTPKSQAYKSEAPKVAPKAPAPKARKETPKTPTKIETVVAKKETPKKQQPTKTGERKLQPPESKQENHKVRNLTVKTTKNKKSKLEEELPKIVFSKQKIEPNEFIVHLKKELIKLILADKNFHTLEQMENKLPDKIKAKIIIESKNFLIEPKITIESEEFSVEEFLKQCTDLFIIYCNIQYGIIHNITTNRDLSGFLKFAGEYIKRIANIAYIEDLEEGLEEDLEKLDNDIENIEKLEKDLQKLEKNLKGIEAIKDIEEEIEDLEEEIETIDYYILYMKARMHLHFCILTTILSKDKEGFEEIFKEYSEKSEELLENLYIEECKYGEKGSYGQEPYIKNSRAEDKLLLQFLKYKISNKKEDAKQISDIINDNKNTEFIKEMFSLLPSLFASQNLLLMEIYKDIDIEGREIESQIIILEKFSKIIQKFAFDKNDPEGSLSILGGFTNKIEDLISNTQPTGKLKDRTTRDIINSLSKIIKSFPYEKQEDLIKNKEYIELLCDSYLSILKKLSMADKYQDTREVIKTIKSKLAGEPNNNVFTANIETNKIIEPIIQKIV